MPEGVDRVLEDLQAGRDVDRSQLLACAYTELHGIALRQMRAERAGHTLQPTALVHEAYLRMVGSRNLDRTTRTRFLAAGAEAIRRVLVDHARARLAEKRGGARDRIDLPESELGEASVGLDVLELGDTLDHFERAHPRQHRVVELRCFGGLATADIAALLGVSERTVANDWDFAKAWLRRRLSGAARA